MKNMNSLINSNSLLTVSKMLWIDSHFILNTLQIKTMKHNSWIICCHTILLIMSDNLITLNTHQSHNKIITMNSFVKTKIYIYIQSILSNQINHMNQTNINHLTTTNIHSSMFSSTILHSHNTTIYSIYVIHAEWSSGSSEIYELICLTIIKWILICLSLKTQVITSITSNTSYKMSSSFFIHLFMTISLLKQSYFTLTSHQKSFVWISKASSSLSINS